MVNVSTSISPLLEQNRGLAVVSVFMYRATGVQYINTQPSILYFALTRG